MLFDKTKIQTIEATISEIFRSFPIDNRCAKIVYSPCFKSLFFEARTRNFFSKKYKVYSINQILESVHTKKETTLSEKNYWKDWFRRIRFFAHYRLVPFCCNSIR